MLKSPLQLKLNDHKLILGSKSPRRKQLLQELHIPFEVLVKDIDESFPENLPGKEVAEYLAKKKAVAFQKELEVEKNIVITADSIVCIDEVILNKPNDTSDAYRMLALLPCCKHDVYTGVCISGKFKTITFSSKTEVSFKTLSPEEINFYVEKYKPFDKAGSYGIQEWIGSIGIENIFGSYTNVMGLPLKELYEQLLAF